MMELVARVWGGPDSARGAVHMGKDSGFLVIVPTEFPAESWHRLAGQACEPSSIEIEDNGVRSLSSTAHHHLTLIIVVY